jgi:hypothetical protein
MRIAGGPYAIYHTGFGARMRRVEKPSASMGLHDESATRAQPPAALGGNPREERASPSGTKASHCAPEPHFETAFVAQVLGQMLERERKDCAGAARAYESAAAPRRKFIRAL